MPDRMRIKLEVGVVLGVVRVGYCMICGIFFFVSFYLRKLFILFFKPSLSIEEAIEWVQLLLETFHTVLRDIYADTGVGRG